MAELNEISPAAQSGKAHCPQFWFIIVQHPDGSPMKLAIDTDAVRDLPPPSDRPRLRYSTNTAGGSSGSPCFNMDWELVAIHHFGDPAWVHPYYNQGIPAHLIQQDIVAAGHGDLLNQGTAMPLPYDIVPRAIGDAIGDRFSFDELSEIMAISHGEIVIHEVTSKETPRRISARECIEYTRKRGLVAEMFLETAKRTDVEDKLRRQLTEVLRTGFAQYSDVTPQTGFATRWPGGSSAIAGPRMAENLCGRSC